MKTTDLFKSNRSAMRLNESLEKVFGQRINLETFDLPQLQDARNKLRTQISQVRNQSGFNETIENEALTKAQWMLDAINAEMAQREDIYQPVQEGFFDEMMEVVERIRDQHGPDLDRDEFGKIFRDMIEQEYGSEAAQEAVDDMDFVWTQYTDPEDGEPSGSYDSSDDADALASAGHGSDEDYGFGYHDESQQQGEDMKKVTEGEIQQAQSIVTAKTMVDRVGRWIEELSGMENDTLLQLGDQIRDEMGSEQAKNFISAVAPAIQQALENLKTTRETLATGVRTLTGEEQAAGMLGAEPGAEGGDEMAPAEPDEMNAEPAMGGEDEFAAAEPAAGGLEDSGREQRESIQYQNSLLRVLAG